MHTSLQDYIDSEGVAQIKLSNVLSKQVIAQVHMWMFLFNKANLSDAENSVMRILSESVMVNVGRILRDENNEGHEKDSTIYTKQ